MASASGRMTRGRGPVVRAELLRGGHRRARVAVTQPPVSSPSVAEMAHGQAEVEGAPSGCPGLRSDMGDLLRQVEVRERHGDLGVEGSVGHGVGGPGGNPEAPVCWAGCPSQRPAAPRHVRPALGAPASLGTATLSHRGLPHEQEVRDGGRG